MISCSRAVGQAGPFRGAADRPDPLARLEQQVHQWTADVTRSPCHQNHVYLTSDTARHGAVLPQLTVEPSLSVSALADRMGMSLTTASELLSDLSRAGLVERREDPANRRRTLVSLAPRHRAMVEGFVALRAAPLLRVLDDLTPSDRQGFVAGLTAWAREVRNW